MIDLRVLRPLDGSTIVGSAMRARRAVVIDEGWRSVGLSAEVAATIAEAAFGRLLAPVARVCGAELPMPCAAHLERAGIPQPEDVTAAVRLTPAWKR